MDYVDLQVFYHFLLPLLIERQQHMLRRRHGDGLPGAVSAAGPLQLLTSQAVQGSLHYERQEITRRSSALCECECGHQLRPKRTHSQGMFDKVTIENLRSPIVIAGRPCRTGKALSIQA